MFGLKSQIQAKRYAQLTSAMFRMTESDLASVRAHNKALHERVRVLADRIGELEEISAHRFDLDNTRLETMAAMSERLAQLEGLNSGLNSSANNQNASEFKNNQRPALVTVKGDAVVEFTSGALVKALEEGDPNRFGPYLG